MSTHADISDVKPPLALPFRRLWPLAILVLTHAAAAYALGQMVGVPFNAGMPAMLAMLFGILLPWFLLFLLIWRVVVMFRTEKPERPIPQLIGEIKAIVTDADRMIGGSIAFLLTSLMIGAFGHFKMLIDYLNPFAWDETFAAWDRALHFGMDPWALFWPVLGNPYVTTFINGAYHFWLFLMYFAVVVACFSKTSRLRSLTFLLALALTFIIGGNILATVFSSAGPVYYDRLGLGADFEAQMMQLYAFQDTSPVWALSVQEGLWQGHVANGPISGISAMPSMHVATTFVALIYAWSHSLWARWFMILFTITIQLGSFHLGWHYALDGYAGAAIAGACWWIAARIMRRTLGQGA